MLDLHYYLDRLGRSPFRKWFENLDPVTRAKIAVRLHRMASGNLSGSKSVGGGVIELRVDTGPGYRIYYGRVGDLIVILLLGGSKAGQKRDIEMARKFWDDYRERSSGT